MGDIDDHVVGAGTHDLEIFVDRLNAVERDILLADGDDRTHHEALVLINRHLTERILADFADGQGGFFLQLDDLRLEGDRIIDGARQLGEVRGVVAQ